MQVGEDIIIYILFGLLGIGWKCITNWMKQVSGDLEQIKQQPMVCVDRFLSREDYEQGKKHVWEKLQEHEMRLRELELGER